jgi:hypothetical protein
MESITSGYLLGTLHAYVCTIYSSINSFRDQTFSFNLFNLAFVVLRIRCNVSEDQIAHNSIHCLVNVFAQLNFTVAMLIRDL